ncbi:MAG: hypothetical protein IPN17_18440 [Deltaproteobacteria bacterium]|nr:hypothetical protein [Deltaproteobacteria bacterium]
MTLRRCLLLLALAGCDAQPSAFDRDGGALFDGGSGTPDVLAPGDAPRPDVIAPGDASRPAGRIRVVTGPAPVRPLRGVTIRAVGGDAMPVEAVTDEAGEAAMDLPTRGGPWTLTAARRGFSAVSIVGLTEAPDGVIRLDAPIDFGEGGGVRLEGTITGAARDAFVWFDALNTDLSMPLSPGQTSFQTLYYLEFPELPLAVTALELVDGHATRIARSQALVRDGSPRDGVTVTLPAAPSGFRTVTVPIATPAPSSIAGVGLRGDPTPRVWQLDTQYQRSTVSVGVARLAVTPSAIEANFEVVDGELAPNLGAVRFEADAVTTNLFVHRFDGAERLSVPNVTALDASGDSLGALTVQASADGADAFGLFLSPSIDAAPRWRCFFLPGALPARLPDLPAGVTLADIGLGARSVNVATIAFWMHAGRVWATPNSDGPVLGYGATVTGVYRTVSNAWR